MFFHVMTLAVSLALILIFRQIDKSDRQVEKIKKISEKKRSEFDKYFADHDKSFVEQEVKLKATQSETVAAVARLERLVAETGERAKTFEDSLATLTESEARIARFDSLLSDILDMTGTAEKNLQTLQEESRFIDKTAKKLQTQKASLDKLEERIPALVEGFSKENQARLQTEAASLREFLAKQSRNLAETAEKAVAENSRLADEIHATYESAINEAVSHAATLETETFKELQEAITRNADTFRKELATSEQSLRKNADDKLQKSADKVQNAVAACTQKADGFVSKYTSQAEKALGEITSRVEALFGELEAAARQRGDSFSTEIDAELAVYKDRTKSMLKALETEGAIAVEKAQVAAESAEATAAKAAESARATAEAAAKDAKLVAESAANEVKATAESAASEAKLVAETAASEAKATADTAATETTAALERTLLALNQKAGALETEITQKVGTLEAEVTQSAKDLRETLSRETQAAITNCTANVDATRDEVSRFTADAVQDLRDTAQSSLDALRGELEETVSAALSTQRAEFLEKIDTELLALTRKNEESTKRVQAEAAELFDRITADTARQKEHAELLDKAQGELEVSLKNAQDEFDSALRTMRGTMAEKMRQADAMLTELTETVSGQRAKVDAALDDAMRMSTGAYADKENAFFASLGERLEETKGDLFGRFSGLDERFEQMKGDILNRFGRLEEMRKDIGALEADLRSLLSDTEERIGADFEKYAGERREEQAAFASSLKATSDELQERLNSLETELDGIKDEAYGAVSDKLQAFEAKIVGDLEKQGETIGADLENWKFSFMQKMEGIVAENQASLSEAFQKQRGEQETALRDEARTFEAAQNRSLKQMEEQLAGMQESVNAFQTRMNGVFDTCDRDAEEKHAEITARIEALKTAMDATLATYDENSRNTLSQLEGAYSDMLSDTQKRIAETNADAESRLAKVLDAVQGIRQRSDEAQGTVFKKIQAEANALNATLDGLARRVKDFEGQNKALQRTEETRQRLAEQVAELKAEISKFDSYEDTAEKIEKRFSQISRFEADIAQKEQKFSLEKKRLDLMETEFDHLISLSNEIQGKLSALKNTHDEVLLVEADVRKFREALETAGKEYERLEKMAPLLQDTVDGVEQSFESLKSIEVRLASCGARADALPQRLGDIEAGVQKLLGKQETVNAVAKKLDSLEDIIKNTDVRMTKLQQDREWLERTEARINEIYNGAQKELQLLKDIHNAQTTRPGKNTGPVPVGVKEDVLRLSHEGFDESAIAGLLSLPENTVYTILDYYGREGR